MEEGAEKEGLGRTNGCFTTARNPEWEEHGVSWEDHLERRGERSGTLQAPIVSDQTGAIKPSVAT